MFRRAITEIAGVAPDDVTIHFTPSVPHDARAEVAGACRTREVAPFDRRCGFANKIRQVLAPWRDVAAVAYLDADMIVLTPLDGGDVADTVAGVPVFGAAPDERSLQAVYSRFGPARAGDWLPLTGLRGEPYLTHRNNLNGGLYLVPAGLIAAFGAAWAREATRLLLMPGACDAAAKEFVDQVAAGTALAMLGLRAHHLTRNSPPPIARRWPARLIHDFAKFSVEDRDADGNLRLSPEIAASPKRVALARIVEEVNGCAIGRSFHAYRAFRYALYAEEFGAADRRIGEVEAAPFPFPAVAADMRVHLGAYQQMVRARRRQPACAGAAGAARGP